MPPISPLRAKAIICFSVAILVALSMNMINLGVVYFLRSYREASGSQIGLFSALFWLGYGGGCHLVQPRFKHLSAAACIQLSLILMGIIVLLYALVPWWPLLMLLSLCKGLALSLFWPVVMGWITAGLEGQALNRMMSRFNLSWSCGMIVGPYIAGWLGDRDTILPLYAGVGFYAVALVLLITVVRLQPEASLDRSGGVPQDRHAEPVDRSTPLRFPAWLGLFASFAALGVIINVFPLAAFEQLGMSRSTVGALFFQRSLLSTFTFLLLGSTIFWHFRTWPMVSSTLAQAVLYALLIWALQLSSLVVLFCLMGIVTAMSYNASLFHGAAGSPDRTARMAMHESLIGAGLVVGSVTGGWLYQYYGMVTVYVVTTAALVVAALMQLLIAVMLMRDRPPADLAA